MMGGGQACYQSEGIKFIHLQFSLQNGRFASVKGSSERERERERGREREQFYVQGGLKRCVLLRSSVQESSNISSISIEGKHLRVLAFVSV